MVKLKSIRPLKSAPRSRLHVGFQGSGKPHLCCPRRLQLRVRPSFALKHASQACFPLGPHRPKDDSHGRNRGQLLLQLVISADGI